MLEKEKGSRLAATATATPGTLACMASCIILINIGMNVDLFTFAFHVLNVVKITKNSGWHLTAFCNEIRVRPRMELGAREAVSYSRGAVVATKTLSSYRPCEVQRYNNQQQSDTV